MESASETIWPLSPAVTDPAAERPHLLLFTPAYDERGGIARRSRLLAAGLVSRGWRVSVVTRTSARWFRVTCSPDLNLFEVPGYPLRRTGTLLYMACAIPAGLVWARRATVLASIKLFSTSTVAAVCGSVARRPFVAMATTSGPAGEVAELTAGDRVGLKARRALLRGAATLIAQTQEGADELAAVFSAAITAVIPTPVELVEAPALTGAPRVMFAGRLSRDKALSALLESWRTVVAERPDATLTLVGEGGFHESVEEELRRTVEADPALRRTVRFTGWVPDVRPWLEECDVFVLPSLHLQEGMSNALVEACAWGRVVVPSDIPANRAVVGQDYPLLVPPGDAAALATAILGALSDEGVRAVAREQALRRAGELSVDGVCARLDEVLRAAVRGVSVNPRG